MKYTMNYSRICFTCFLIVLGMSIYAQNSIDIALVKWSFRTQTSLLCDMAKKSEVKALDMVDSDKWDIVLQKGLTIAVADGADLGMERGFCDRRWHQQLIENYSRLIPLLGAKGIHRIVCYSGVNTDLSDEEALNVCAEGIKPLLDIAKKFDVTLVMELLSSCKCEETFTKQRFVHYQCDNPEWGVALCKKLESPNFKLLYDVWHMNDMNRDVMADVKKYHSYIAHYHVAGIPNRGGLSKKDTFDYRGLVQLLHKTGYRGFIGLEPDRIEKDLEGTIERSVTILK